MSLSAAPPDVNFAAIQHSFGRLLTVQGQRCVQAGEVQIEQVRALNEKDLEVSGQVREPQGQKTSRLRSYETRLYYRPEEAWLLSGDCSCPAGSDCQHCAALACAWLELQPEPLADAGQIARWLAALQAAEGPAEQPIKPVRRTEQIVYLLHPAAETLNLELALGLQVASAPGKAWQKLRLLRPRQLLQSEAAARLQPAERELLELLASSERGQLPAEAPARLPLRGNSGAFVLRELLASGRCFWQLPPRKDQQQALHLSGERQIQAGWKSLPGGQQWTVHLVPEAPGLPPGDRPPLFCLGATVFYYDAQQGCMGPVAMAADKLQLWLQAPVIPEPELERVSRALLQILPAPPLPHGLALREVPVRDSQPTPVLYLSRATLPPASEATAASPTTATPAPLHQARLYFNYADQRLPFCKDAPPEASLLSESEQRVYRIQRVPELERQAYQQLLASGLLPLAQTENAFAFASPEQTFDALHQARNWHHWLHEALPALQAAGWQIEFAADFRLDFISSPAWQAELTATDARGDCFALSLGVEINGQPINLLPLLLRVLRSVPDLQALRQDLTLHSHWLLPLDPEPLALWAAQSQHKSLPRQWLEVPTRRLARILDLLIELYDFIPAAETPEQLELSYYAALQMQSQARLNPDDYGVVWQAPAALREAARLLAGQPQDGPARAVPAGLKAQLRPYQQRGFQWLSQLRALGLNGILADDMGLGKTLQTLCLLLAEQAEGRLTTPALVVVPTSVLGVWQAEARRFAPGLRLLCLHGPERPRSLAELRQADLLLTSYTLFRQDARLHQQITYQWLILDEAQMIKNPRSRSALALCAQPARHRLCLTGTPIENHLQELWSLFHFLMPGFLDTLERFQSRFRNPIEKTNDRQRLAALRERLAPFVLRRLKSQVAQDLPPKTEILRTVELGTAQRDLYETVRLAVNEQVRKEVAQNGFQRARILVLDALLKLRQICAHPHLLQLPEARKVQRSAKLELLLELLTELLASGRRILIFSQFVTMLEIIEKALQQRAISYCKLTGRTRRREAEIARFQAGEAPVFLISLKAGGVGLNLTAADTVIHYDPWWNPAAEQQATDRSWRIGQSQPVFVYKLIAAGTLEEQIVALQDSKRALSQDLLEGGPQKWEQQHLLALLQGSSL